MPKAQSSRAAARATGRRHIETFMVMRGQLRGMLDSRRPDINRGEIQARVDALEWAIDELQHLAARAANSGIGREVHDT